MRAGLAHPIPLRVRLLLGTLIWMAGALVAAGFVLNGLFRDHVMRQFQEQLVVQLDLLAAGVMWPQGGLLTLQSTALDPRFDTPVSGLYWQVQVPGQPAQLRSRSLWDADLPDLTANASSATQSHPSSSGTSTVSGTPRMPYVQGELVVRTLQGPDQRPVLYVQRLVSVQGDPERQVWLGVAGDLGSTQAALQQWRKVLVLFLGILFVSLALAAVVQVYLGLAPLRRLHTSMVQLGQGRIQRIEGHYPIEIQPLIDDFNRVLEANEHMLVRARHQAGDLAHALKTPLTIMQTAVQNSRDKGDLPADLDHTLTTQLTALNEQVQWQLKRARRAALVGAPHLRTPIVPALESVLRVLRKVYAQRQLEFICLPVAHDASPDDLCFQGELQDLQEMVGNLLDNACKWADHRVQCRVMAHDTRHVVIQIDDDGPGVSPDQYEHVVQRGRRADESVPGTGLGLSIVSELAHVHGGSLTLHSSELGGLQVRLILPRARPVRSS